MRQSLRLFGFMFESAPWIVVSMTGAGVLSGLFSVGVVAVITRTLYHEESVTVMLAVAFAALVGGKIVTSVVAQLLLTRFTQGTILDLSLTLARRILASPLRLLEQRGAGRILATLTDDVSMVTWSVQCIPKLAVNAAVVVGCGAYMAWLSWPLFLLACLVVLAGAIALRFLNARAFAVILAAREARSRLFEVFRTLTDGTKELKMHRARREEFLGDDLRSVADDYRQRNLDATGHQVKADAFAQFLLYGLIGLLLFASPTIARPTAEVLTGYVLTMLYMMGPLWTLIETVPVVMRGQAAFAAIERLGVSLVDPDSAGFGTPDLVAPSTGVMQLEMRQVVFAYDGAEATGRPFTLGPLDFAIRPGEIVFVVGGNGSGKSTFVKLLTGLYPAQQGEILVGGVRIDAAHHESYSAMFSVVFSDFHVFRKLLGLWTPDLAEATHAYLKLLRIDEKVSLQGREFSTTELSQGQRKRLALVVAYLEDRPVFVFDEWAADQDPEYKRIFYHKLLPDLRARGKMVVVITHDDRYFEQADRIVRLEDGRVAAPDNPTIAASSVSATGASR